MFAGDKKSSMLFETCLQSLACHLHRAIFLLSCVDDIVCDWNDGGVSGKLKNNYSDESKDRNGFLNEEIL